MAGCAVTSATATANAIATALFSLATQLCACQGWHIRHQTDQGVADEASGPKASAWQKAARKTLFISYIVPIHYNSVVPNASANSNAPASEAKNVSS